MPKHNALPFNLPPRGLQKLAAAQYVGICDRTFDVMVADGRMPKPRRVGKRAVWDIRALDRAFDALPSDDNADAPNEWDAVL